MDESIWKDPTVELPLEEIPVIIYIRHSSSSFRIASLKKESKIPLDYCWKVLGSGYEYHYYNIHKWAYIPGLGSPDDRK